MVVVTYIAPVDVPVLVAVTSDLSGFFSTRYLWSLVSGELGTGQALLLLLLGGSCVFWLR